MKRHYGWFSWFNRRNDRSRTRHATRRLTFLRLEDRRLLSASVPGVPNPSPDLVDFGIVAQNAATGAFTDTRFNGTGFVNETLATWLPTVDRRDMVVADVLGLGRQQVFMRDANTGVWWGLWYTGASYTTQALTNWNPKNTYSNVQAGRISGDGHQDIVGFDNLGNWWMLSNPSGGTTTTLLGTWSTGINWQNIVVGDIDGSGRDEILGRDPSTGNWTALGWNGSGYSSSVIANWKPGINFQNVQLTNMTGTPDIIGRDPTTGNWWITDFNNGTVTTSVVALPPSAAYWQNIQVGDFYGTGRAVILGYDHASGDWFSVQSVSGGSFKTQQVAAWDPKVSWQNVMLGNLWGSGGMVLVADNPANGGWIGTWSTGGGIATSYLQYWYGANWQSAMMGDVNGDGRADIVAEDPATGNWAVTWSDGANLQSAVMGNWNLSANFTNFALVNLNGVGGDELMARDAGTWNWTSLQFNGTSYVQQQLTAWQPYGSNWQFVQEADINGDGGADLIGRNPVTGDWWATLYTGTVAQNIKIANWSPAVNWQNVQVADINGDSRADLIGRDPTTGNWWAITYNGSTFTNQIIGNWNPARTWQNVLVGDFFGLGRPAILGQDAGSGAWMATWYTGGGYQTSVIAGWYPASWQNVTLTDINGDGRVDILGRDPKSGNWYVTSSNGTSISTQLVTNWSTSTTWQSVQFGDFWGIGRSAILGLTSTGQWYATWFIGTGYTTAFVQGWYAANWQNIAIVDVTGDGRADLVGRDPNNGWWAMTSYTGSQLSTQVIATWSTSINWQNITFSDINNDGAVDIVGYDPASGNWTAIQSNGASFTSQVVFNWAAGPTWQNVMGGDVPGVSDATLRMRIVNQTPGLLSALAAGNTLQAANLLLNWSANAADMSLDNTTLFTGGGPASFYFYNEYLPNVGGSFCSGVASFYTEVLALFGINAFTVGFGDIPGGGLTHTTVIVPQLVNGVWQDYIFDPTMNVTYHDATTGNYLTYFDLINDFNSGNFAQIQVVQGSLAARKFLSATAQTSSSLVFVGYGPGDYVYNFPTYGMNAYLQTYGPLFTTDGFLTGLPGLIQLMEFHVYNVFPSNSAAAQQFVAALQSPNIAFG